MRQRGSFQRVPAYSSRTGAESASRPGEAAGRSKIGGIDLDGVDPDGKRNECRRQLEPGVAPGRSCPRPLLVELQPRLAGKRPRSKAAGCRELGLDLALVDIPYRPASLLVESGR